MVRHIILWKIKEDKTKEEKELIKQNVKHGLEGLYGKIEGLEKIHVQTESLSSSNADLMLDSTFTDAASLNAYSVNPLHVEVANNSVRPYMEIRMCLDFEE